MAKTVRDTKLESRPARAKLPQRREPYWKGIGQGLHLGYYRGSKTGTWHVRYRGDRKKYVSEVLAQADDIMDSDGMDVLSFFEAQERARAWHVMQQRAETGIRSTAQNYTVDAALDDYLAWFKTERKSVAFTQNTLDTHIRPELGHIELKKLTTKQITDWRNKLATTPPRIRSTALSSEVKYKKLDDGATDEWRKRKSSANRTLTILKAALNHAYREGFIGSDDAWRRVKPFHNVDNPTKVFLTHEECKRFINACEASFRNIVQAALFTGCRYGELGKLTCADIDIESGSCLIRASKTGKSRRVTLSDEAIRFFTNLAAGKRADALLITHDNGSKWGKSHQNRLFANALKSASISKEISFYGLRDTHASHLAMQGVPMAVIAAQLGNSARICEKHYAHLSPNYVTDTIRANLPVFGTPTRNKVASLNITAAKKRARA
jgi:integrase